MLLLSNGSLFYGSGLVTICDYFIFDSISFYLILLVLLLGVCRKYYFFNLLRYRVRFFLFMSLTFSILCFCISHSVLFWVFYELSMLPLLYLIFNNSPYSERFLAG